MLEDVFGTVEFQHTVENTYGSGSTRHVQEEDWKYRSNCLVSWVTVSNFIWGHRNEQSLSGLPKARGAKSGNFDEGGYLLLRVCSKEHHATHNHLL
jgi:hypothetical protein